MTRSRSHAPAPGAKAKVQPENKKPGRRIQVRRSGVHGKGVFALTDIVPGERIIEYTGEVITWKEALRRHPHDPAQPNHTFYFHLDDGHVIDALYGGNASRWINHSCAPNCEADEDGDRIYITALRHIYPGEELHYDYGLVIDAPLTASLKAEYPCWCGGPNCRGTLLTGRQKVKPGHQPARKKKPARPKTAAKARP